MNQVLSFPGQFCQFVGESRGTKVEEERARDVTCGVLVCGPDIQNHNLSLLQPQLIKLGNVNVFDFLRVHRSRGRQYGFRFISSAYARVGEATRYQNEEA